MLEWETFFEKGAFQVAMCLAYSLHDTDEDEKIFIVRSRYQATVQNTKARAQGFHSVNNFRQVNICEFIFV